MLTKVAMLLAGAGAGLLRTASLMVHVTAACPVEENFHVSYSASGISDGDIVRVFAVQEIGGGAPTEDQVYSGAAATSDTINVTWGARTDVEFFDPVTIWARVEIVRDSTVVSSIVTNIEGPFNIESPATCPGDFN